MFTNYCKIAIRNLWRNKGFSAINIFGLAIGLATFLLIVLFVTDELSYDKYMAKADRIYRINADFSVNGSTFNERTVPAKLGPALVKDYPAIERMVRTRMFGKGDIAVRRDNETLVEHNCVYADSTLPEVFGLPMIEGDPKTALVQPMSLVVSESIAKKYFNSTHIIGKTLLVEQTHLYRITGVIKDMPAQSHVHYNFLMAMSELDESRTSNWMSDNFETYVLVRPGTSPETVNNYLKEATKKYMEAELIKMIGSSVSELDQKGGHFRYTTIPVTKIHLYSTITNEAEPSGNIQYVYIFTVIAIFILLIACVNFMNLSTARSAGRSKEVGVRKVLGSGRGDLVLQFLVESMLISCIALVLAIGIAGLLLPYLNQLSGKQIAADFIWTPGILPALAGVAIVVGLLAGSYPAFFLSAFEPIKVLKGRLASGFRGSWLRNSLVVFQFATAIILIVGTFVIYSQLRYIRNKKLGYNRELVVVLPNVSALGNHSALFRKEVLQIPGVQAGTMTNTLPTSTSLNTDVFSKDAARSAGQVMGLGEWYIDADYIPTLGIQMAGGRNFSPLLPTDSNAVLINETAARLLGYSDLKSRYLYVGGPEGHPVIGIVKDFNTGSLRNKIPPIVFRLGDTHVSMAFRVSGRNITDIIEKIGNKYHAMEGMAAQPFNYTFLDDDFNRLYMAEERTGKIFLSFASFAILIACLGLFGLVTYAATQRTREIGIRKVLGASVPGIVAMLSKDFLKLVIIALVVASPVAWFIMDRWLQDFAFRIYISWWIFVLTAVLAILITLVTVGLQAIRSALANPVESLLNE